MFRLFCLAAAWCLFGFLPAWAGDSVEPVVAPLVPVLTMTEVVPQGGILQARLVSPFPIRARASLVVGDSGPAVHPRLFLEAQDGMVWHYALVAGIPFDQPAGSARLFLTLQAEPETGPYPAWQTAPGQTIQLEGGFKIRTQAFRVETIQLSGAMAAIKTVPDPRKDEQIRRYAAVLATVDPGAVWITGPLEGAFVRPVASERHTAWFGDHRTYRYPDGSRESNGHFGVDYGVPTGTPVVAPARGRVVLAENRITTGWTVILEHLPGVYSIFMHLDSLQVGTGELVEQSALLGQSGATGFATGPHLHWELRVATVACDPESLLAVPARLDRELAR